MATAQHKAADQAPLFELAAPQTVLRGVLPPVYQISNPLEHTAALWPGFLEKNPQGGKAVFPIQNPKFPDNPEAKTDRRVYVRQGVSPEQRNLEYQDATEYLARQENTFNKYISVNTFTGWRRLENLRNLTAFYIDLDLKEVPGNEPDADGKLGAKYGADFMRMRQDALDNLAAHQIPQPNLAVHTGRGVHLYWLFDRLIPAKAHSRWKAAMKQLIDVLKPNGADPKVCDAPRILRLVGTYNSKVITPLDVQGLGGRIYTVQQPWKVTCEVLSPQRQSFDFLCDQILPLTREQLQVQRAARALQIIELGPRQAEKGAKVKTRLAPGNRTGRHYSATAIARLGDIELLARTLYPQGVVEGKRDLYLFHATVNLAWICRKQTLENEMLRWKDKYVPSLTDGEALATMSTAMRYAFSAYDEEGEKHSVYDDKRYVFAAKTMWKLFGSDVQAAGLEHRMQGIVTEGVLAERQKAYRRSLSANHYTGLGIRTSNIAKAVLAHQMHAEGVSARQIAVALNTTAKTACSWLQLAPESIGLPTAAASIPVGLQTDAVAISYPQANAISGPLPKSLLNNGEASRFLEAPVLTAVAQGIPKGGRSPPLVSAAYKASKSNTVVTYFAPQNSKSEPICATQSVLAEPSTQLAVSNPKPTILATPPRSPSMPITAQIQPTDTPKDGFKSNRVAQKTVAHKQVYSDELLLWLRELSVIRTLHMLGVDYKVDATFIPRKSSETGRVHITSKHTGQVLEIVHTKNKWIDKPNEKRGGGAIDLAMHVMSIKFGQAMKVLMASEHVPIGLRSK